MPACCVRGLLLVLTVHLPNQGSRNKVMAAKAEADDSVAFLKVLKKGVQT